MTASVAPMVLLLTFVNGIGLPLSMPPLPPDPVVERAAPQECVYYLGWNGTAKPKANSKNRTEQLLADQEVQEFVNQLSAQVVGAVGHLAQGHPQREVVAENLPGLLKTLVTHPTTLYLAQFQPDDRNLKLRAGLVVNVGKDREAAAAAIAKLEESLAANLNDAAGKLEPATVGGLKLKRFTPAAADGPPTLLWGFKDNLFILAVGNDEAEALIARLSAKGKAPSWLGELHKQLPVERVAVTSYINIALGLKMILPGLTDETKRKIEALGLARVKAFGNVGGMSATGTIGKSQLLIDGERIGLLGFLPTKSLTVDDLKIAPRDATLAEFVRFDLVDAYQKYFALYAALDPDGSKRTANNVLMIEQQVGFKLVDDLLKPLGDSWSLSSSGGQAGNLWTGLVLTASLSDQAKLAQTNQKILTLIRGALQQQGAPEKAGFSLNESKVGETAVYTINLKGPVPIAPTWAISKDHLVLTLSPPMMKSVLDRDPKAESLADVKVLRTLLGRPGGPSVVYYEDTQTILTQLYAAAQVFGPLLTAQLAQQGIQFSLPPLPSLAKLKPYLTPTITVVRNTKKGYMTERHASLPMSLDATAVAPLAVAIMLPASRSARVAAQSNQSTNNLHQLALGMQVFHGAQNRLPAPANYDEKGKPLLSWRVKLLPYVEWAALYNQFHLDEPWDSDHNKTLIALMPPVFADPRHPELAQAFKTRYVMPRGEGTVFQGEKGPNFREIRDGTSKTLMLLEAAPDRAVIWTKPDDLTIDPKDPLAGLKGNPEQGFLAVFVDGSVRSIGDSIDPKVFRLLLNPSDGQPINMDDVPMAGAARGTTTTTANSKTETITKEPVAPAPAKP